MTAKVEKTREVTVMQLARSLVVVLPKQDFKKGMRVKQKIMEDKVIIFKGDRRSG